jgi:uncharacterized membrane protein YhiD involved in acid resistance
MNFTINKRVVSFGELSINTSNIISLDIKTQVPVREANPFLLKPSGAWIWILIGVGLLIGIPLLTEALIGGYSVLIGFIAFFYSLYKWTKEEKKYKQKGKEWETEEDKRLIKGTKYLLTMQTNSGSTKLLSHKDLSFIQEIKETIIESINLPLGNIITINQDNRQINYIKGVSKNLVLNFLKLDS